MKKSKRKHKSTGSFTDISRTPAVQSALSASSPTATSGNFPKAQPRPQSWRETALLVGGISVVGLILEGLRRWTVSAGTPRAKPAAVRVRAKAKKLVARKKKKIAAPIAKRARSAAKRVAQKTLSH